MGVRVMKSSALPQLAKWAAPLALGVALTLAARAPARAQAAAENSAGDALAAHRHDYQDLQNDIAAAQARKRAIEDEISSYQNDRASLVAAAIDAREKIEAAEARVAESQARLDALTGSQAAIKGSLDARRDVLAAVLAALQRLGRKPPPALLADPSDVLRAIRASIELGAVLPQLRGETEALASDLRDLVALREKIALEKAALAQDVSARRNERERLEALIDARQKSIGAAREKLAAEQARADVLARQAASLKDLVGRMEGELDSARKAADLARQADEARAKLTEQQAEAARRAFADAAQRDPARLAPAIAFADAKGLLHLPAAGKVIKFYGAASEFGGVEKGLSLATRPSAIVSAPSDGYIAFSGPWRTYGQLLIVNAGDGYYVVMAGMARVDVAVGQFVLAGEPVGVMGDGAAKTAATVATGAAQPVLYVEFRKDGAAIDPGPWWSKSDILKSDTQRIRG